MTLFFCKLNALNLMFQVSKNSRKYLIRNQEVIFVMNPISSSLNVISKVRLAFICRVTNTVRTLFYPCLAVTCGQVSACQRCFNSYSHHCLGCDCKGGGDRWSYLPISLPSSLLSGIPRHSCSLSGPSGLRTWSSEPPRSPERNPAVEANFMLSYSTPH